VLVEEVLSKDSGGDGVREDGRPLAMYLRDGMLVFLLGGVHSRGDEMPRLDQILGIATRGETTRSARSG